ncbi:hypothetical protein CN918_26145 [Priestia megaterium]|nr:hypothetical protein CN918_26145 [Priestia megaterium]
MRTYLPKNPPLLKEMKQGDKFDIMDIKQRRKDKKKNMLGYNVDYDIVNALEATQEHEELVVKRGVSVEMYGLCTLGEVEQLKGYEFRNTLKILSVTHESEIIETYEGADLQEEIESHFYEVHVILHINETESFIKQNILPFVEAN